MSHSYAGLLPVPLLVLDNKLHIVYSNELAKAVFPPLSLGKSTPLESLLHEDDQSNFRVRLESPASSQVQVKGRFKTGNPAELRWCELRGVRTLERETLNCVLLDIHDEVLSAQQISDERADAYAHLEKAQLSRNQFLDIMSHELRTPLTAILGLSEALTAGLYGTIAEDQLEAIRTINDCGANLLGLINDILDVTKLETGKIRLHPEVLSAREICESAIRLHSNMAREKGVEFVVNAELPDSSLIGDRKRLKQCLSHLVDNAIKFGSAQSKVTIEIEQRPNNVHLHVLDEGPGIPPNDLPNLLAPFRQSDQSLARHYEGAGLGLSLAKKLVDLMGGSLEAQNRPEKGACFSLILPIATTEVATTPTIPKLCGEGTVLVVDDHEATVKLLGDALRTWGFEAEAFSDTSSLQSRPKDQPARAILMDGKLPDGNGLECIRWLRKQPEYRNLPIVFLTASEGLELKAAGMEAGASAFIEKPVKLSALARCLERLLTI